MGLDLVTLCVRRVLPTHMTDAHHAAHSNSQIYWIVVMLKWFILGTIFWHCQKSAYFVIDKKNPICKILAAFCLYQEIFQNIKFWSCQELLPKGYKTGMLVGVCQQGSSTIVTVSWIAKCFMLSPTQLLTNAASCRSVPLHISSRYNSTN